MGWDRGRQTVPREYTLARFGTPWHGCSDLFQPSPLPAAEEPPGQASGESELQEHEAGLPCAHLPPAHTAARALLPHLP